MMTGECVLGRRERREIIGFLQKVVDAPADKGPLANSIRGLEFEEAVAAVSYVVEEASYRASRGDPCRYFHLVFSALGLSMMMALSGLERINPEKMRADKVIEELEKVGQTLEPVAAKLGEHTAIEILSDEDFEKLAKGILETAERSAVEACGPGDAATVCMYRIGVEVLGALAAEAYMNLGARGVSRLFTVFGAAVFHRMEELDRFAGHEDTLDALDDQWERIFMAGIDLAKVAVGAGIVLFTRAAEDEAAVRRQVEAQRASMVSFQLAQAAAALDRAAGALRGAKLRFHIFAAFLILMILSPLILLSNISAEMAIGWTILMVLILGPVVVYSLWQARKYARYQRVVAEASRAVKEGNLAAVDLGELAVLSEHLGRTFFMTPVLTAAKNSEASLYIAKALEHIRAAAELQTRT